MFEKKVWSFIEREKLFTENDKIVIGVSGSVDSLTLLYFLARNAQKMQWNLIVAHVDHMFRGDESFEDYKFVEMHCRKLGLTFEGIQINVPSLINQSGKNGHQVSREARYNFFCKVMEQYGAKKLALAHHLDDQMESMLMNLTRDVSSPGKLGIPVSRQIGEGRVVRPFLCVSKKEIESCCNTYGLIPRVDSSNEKLIYSRNRFRKKVVPFLKKENPKALEHFAAFNNLLVEDDLFLREMAELEFNKLKIEQINSTYSINLNEFRMLKKPLQRRLLPLILNSLTSLKPFSFSNVHLGLILALIDNSHPSGTIQVDDNFQVMKSFERLLFCFEPYYFPDYEESLVVPGVTVLPNGDRILAEQIPSIQDTSKLNECLIPEGLLPLKIRNKKNGDKIAIANLNGRKKLKKVLLEQRVPVFQRDSWPVIVHDNGSQEILWVPNLVKSKLLNDEKQGNIFIKLTFLSSTFLGRENNGNT